MSRPSAHLTSPSVPALHERQLLSCSITNLNLHCPVTTNELGSIIVRYAQQNARYQKGSQQQIPGGMQGIRYLLMDRERRKRPCCGEPPMSQSRKIWPEICGYHCPRASLPYTLHVPKLSWWYRRKLGFFVYQGRSQGLLLQHGPEFLRTVNRCRQWRVNSNSSPVVRWAPQLDAPALVPSFYRLGYAHQL